MSRLLYLFFIFIPALQAAAQSISQTAAQSALQTTTQTTTLSAAEPIGRLFLTPAERAQLDRQRYNLREPAAATAPKKHLTLNGMITRGNGNTTVWVNQQPQSHFGSAVEGVRVQPTTLSHTRLYQNRSAPSQAIKPDAVALQLSSGQRVHLKPGQTFDTATGKIRDGYEATGTAVPQAAPH